MSIILCRMREGFVQCVEHLTKVEQSTPPESSPSLCQVGLEERRKREEEVASFHRSHQQACSHSQQRSVDFVAAFESKVCPHVRIM